MRKKFFGFLQQVAQGRALDLSSSASLVAWLLVVMGIALVAVPASAQRQDNRVGLVVQFGNEAVVTGCYPYTPGMTGLDLLRQAGLETSIEYQSIGALVCRIGAPTIGADGCDYPRQDCLCQARTLPWRYWAYWHLEGDHWVYADRALSGRALRPGDVDGWAWGIGTTDFGAKPPRLTFDNICPAPTLTPSPVPTSAPPVLPTATTTEAPTRSPPPTVTVTISPTPLPSWTPTVPPTETPVVASMTAPGGPPPSTSTPSPLAEPGRATPTGPPTTIPVASSPTRPFVTPSAPVASPRPALTASPAAAPSVTPTPTPSSVFATPTPHPTTTATPTLRATIARVDLTRLTPVVEGEGPTGASQTPPFSYVFFVVVITGLLVYMLGRRRGVV